jgi:hypothetical protein
MGGTCTWAAVLKLTSRLELRYLRAGVLVADLEPKSVKVRRVGVVGNLDEPELLAARRRRHGQRPFVHQRLDAGRYVFLARFVYSRATHRVRPEARKVLGRGSHVRRLPGGGG